MVQSPIVMSVIAVVAVATILTLGTLVTISTTKQAFAAERKAYERAIPGDILPAIQVRF